MSRWRHRLPALRKDWRKIVRHAWSVRLLGGAFLFIVAETAMPYLEGVLPVPHWLFGILSGVALGGAFVARLLAQKEFGGND